MHDAALEYVAPKMSGAARINFAPAFDGVDAANFRERLPQIVGEIVGRTADALACDASIPELTERMQQAALGPSAAAPGAGAHPGNPAVNGGLTAAQIEQILRVLAPHLRPDELEAVRELLGHEDAIDFANATTMGEDARRAGVNGILARQRIERRLGITLPKIEPSNAPPPQRGRAKSDPAAFYARYPELRK
ncbi:hypothetical protein LG047_08915 [Methylocystis sp. WRRC1]|uniref:hypothetical protein n=1 Tax=Methylocystis sp. WRRC1 TaxID=1732014 RepID=UPI001D152235|nr:hypothetical protein [Methylocystis sp. WRRC1]MCC3245440.1 hypothetical protein [Methylocystis sp. WRRC1]